MGEWKRQSPPNWDGCSFSPGLLGTWECREAKITGSGSTFHHSLLYSRHISNVHVTPVLEGRSMPIFDMGRLKCYRVCVRQLGRRRGLAPLKWIRQCSYVGDGSAWKREGKGEQGMWDGGIELAVADFNCLHTHNIYKYIFVFFWFKEHGWGIMKM